MLRLVPAVPVLAAALLSLGVLAQDSGLTPARLAELQHAEALALQEVDAKFGGRPASELSADERREQIRAREATSTRVLRAQGVDPKAYARRTATLSREEQAQVAAARAELERAGAGPRTAAEVEVVRGTDANDVDAPGEGDVLILRGAEAQESGTAEDFTPGQAETNGVEPDVPTSSPATSVEIVRGSLEGEEDVAAEPAPKPKPKTKTRSKKNR